MKNKKLAISAFTFLVLACNPINQAYAGQNIAKFFGVTQRSALHSVYWLNSNREFADLYAPLPIQQNAENYYYLHILDIPDSVKSISAGMKIQDDRSNVVDDINFGSPDGKICNFQREESGWFCKVLFKANESSPTTEGTRYVYTYSKDSDADFYVLNQELSIAPLSDAGLISITGPDHQPNSITAIAVSDNAVQDSVLLKVKIEDAKPFVKSLRFNFKIMDTSIANADTLTCEITTITQNSGFCTINITPSKVGKTQMKVLNTSGWTDSSEVWHSFTANEIASQTVKINVGTLFAGYNTALSNFMVYRKGSSLDNIDTELKGSLIRGLAVDEPQHKLYVMTKKSLYKQENATEGKLALTKIIDIPTPKVGDAAAQTLNLPDIKNNIIIGTGDNKLFRIEENQKVSIEQLSSGNASIVHSAIDPVNNILYFADSNRGFSIFYSKYSDELEEPEFSHYSPVSTLSDMKVAAHNGKVYMTGSYSTPFKGSKLSIWSFSSKEMKEVAIDEKTNPFKKSSFGIKITSLFFTRQGNLYASGSDGGVYLLINRESKNPEWRLLATIPDIEIIKDNAIDTNGNIYLSSDKGVWKVPFNNPKDAYQLKNYGSGVSAIVVDNNR